MRQIQLAFAFYGLLIACSAFFGWRMRLEVQSFTEKVGKSSAFLLDIQRFSEERYHLQLAAMRHFSEHTSSTLEAFLEHENDIVQRLNEVLASANENRWLLDQDESIRLRSVQMALPQILQGATSQLLDVDVSEDPKIAPSIQTPFLADSQFNRDVEKLLEHERADLGVFQADLERAVSRYRYMVIVATLLGVFVLPAIFVLLRRSVIQPVNALVIAATGLANGREFDEVQRQLQLVTERDDIDPSIRKLAERLESVLKTLGVTLAKVNAVAEDELDDPILDVQSPGALGQSFRKLVSYLQGLASHAELLARSDFGAPQLNKGVLAKAIQQLASKEQSPERKSQDEAA